MKSPEFNVALSKVWEYQARDLQSFGAGSRAHPVVRSLSMAEMDAPKEVAPVCADRVRSRASIDE
jgi:hypothetical protein